MKRSPLFCNETMRRLAGRALAARRGLGSRLGPLWSLPRSPRGPFDLTLAQQRALVARSDLFDPAHYRSQMGADLAADADPLMDFLVRGSSRGRNANPLFDAAWYCEAYADVAAWRDNPLLHYILIGAREGRATSSSFDAGHYLATYRDVARSGMEPLRHYLLFGRQEGRSPVPSSLGVRAARRVTEQRDLGRIRADRPDAALEALFSGADGAALGRLSLALDASASDGQSILHLSHPWGGGTERHIIDLASTSKDRVRHHILQVRPSAPDLRFELMLDSDGELAIFGLTARRLTDLTPLLRRMNPARVHVHYALDVMQDLPALLATLNRPHDVSVHDYALICPRVHLVGASGTYCGEPDEAGCRACLAGAPPPRSSDIASWRETGRALLESAERVICPSVDAARRTSRYAPAARIIAAPHEPDLYRPSVRTVRAITPSARYRVAVLGALPEHKGGAFLLACIEASQSAGMPIDWTVIGWFPPALSQRASRLRPALKVTGAYDNGQIDTLMETVDPHVVMFPQRCPETYCYALSEALGAGRAVFAPDIGAFPERLAGVAAAQLYPAAAAPDVVLERLLRWLEAGKTGAGPSAEARPDGGVVEIDVGFYAERYLDRG